MSASGAPAAAANLKTDIPTPPQAGAAAGIAAAGVAATAEPDEERTADGKGRQSTGLRAGDHRLRLPLLRVCSGRPGRHHAPAVPSNIRISSCPVRASWK